MDGEYDAGDTFNASTVANNNDQINNLDLLLFRNDELTPLAISNSTVGTVEHIFFQIPTQGEYYLRARQIDADIPGGQDFAIAWWAVGTVSTTVGDYNGDGFVDIADYQYWRAHYGSSDPYADGDGNGKVDGGDYAVWRKQTARMLSDNGSGSAVPEPVNLVLAIVAALISPFGRNTRRCYLTHSNGYLATETNR